MQDLARLIFNSPKTLTRIRQAQNVESGLNDRSAIPFFAFFLVLAEAEKATIPPSQWVIFECLPAGKRWWKIRITLLCLCKIMEYGTRNGEEDT
jgi:hypothetical protein